MHLDGFSPHRNRQYIPHKVVEANTSDPLCKSLPHPSTEINPNLTSHLTLHSSSCTPDHLPGSQSTTRLMPNPAGPITSAPPGISVQSSHSHICLIGQNPRNREPSINIVTLLWKCTSDGWDPAECAEPTTVHSLVSSRNELRNHGMGGLRRGWYADSAAWNEERWTTCS